MAKPTQLRQSDAASSAQGRSPNNLRTPAPRPIALLRAKPTARHALRWGVRGEASPPSSGGTPTPPPVSVRIPRPSPSGRGLVATPAPAQPAPRSALRLVLGVVCLSAVAAGGTLALWHTRSRDRQEPVAAALARSDRPSAAELASAAAPQASALGTAESAGGPTVDSEGSTADGAPDEGNDSEAGAESDAAEAPVIAVDRAGQSALPGGVLRLPESFAPHGSGFDLVVHFHGDADVVQAGLEKSGVSAALAVVNLGAGASPYYKGFQAPDALDAVVTQVVRALETRGLEGAHLERLALSAWGVGQGAVASVLGLHKRPGALDAVLIADGIWATGGDAGAAMLLAPFRALAASAASGELLFTLTYSQVDPEGALAAGAFVAAAGAGAVEGHRLAPVALGSGLAPVALEPLAEARTESFHARGFVGTTTLHHMALLADMGDTTFPELAQRWQSRPAPAGARAGALDVREP